MRAFTAVAKELHFGRAARVLNMSEPALSRSIRALERAIGHPLLNRTTRRVSLSEAGRAFLAECELAHIHLARARTAAVAAAEGRSGLLRVGYMDFAINGVLPSILSEFNKCMPEIRIDLIFASSASQRRALFEGRIDVGFLIGETSVRNVENLPLWREHHVAILPDAHHLTAKEKLRVRDLSMERFVLGNAEQFGAYRPLVFEVCAEAGFFPQVVMEASNSTGIFGMVAAGTSVTIYGACAQNIPRRGTVIRPLIDATQDFLIVASWIRDNPLPALRQFVAFLSRGYAVRQPR